MSLVSIEPAASALEGALQHRPELLAKYRTFYQSFWQDKLVPRRTLELVRLRIAHIQGCQGEFLVRDAAVELSSEELAGLAKGDIEIFSDAEQAALALAELMPLDVHGVSDAMVASTDSYFGHAGTVALLTAMAFFDVTCRLKLVLDLPPHDQTLSNQYLA